MNTGELNAGVGAVEPPAAPGQPDQESGHKPDHKLTVTVRQARNAVAVILLVVIVGLILALLSRKASPPGDTVASTGAEVFPAEPPVPPPVTRGEVQLFDGTTVDPAMALSWWPLDPAPEGDIEDLVAHGEAALAAGRWIEPAGDNALQAFLAVLATDPENDAARLGREAVAGHFKIVAVENLANGVLDEAERAIAVLAVAEPDTAASMDVQLQRDRAVVQLLNEAEEFLAGDKLWGNGENNALARFNAINQIKPGHPAVLNGIERAIRRMFAIATWARAQQRYESSVIWLERIESIPTHSLLIEDLIAATGQERRKLFDQIASDVWVAVHSGDVEQASALIEVAERAWSRAEALELLKNELELTRVYGALRPGEVFSDPFVDGPGIGPEMVVIPLGTFVMGSDDSDPDRDPSEEPAVTVIFTRGFALERTEVTVGEFRRFVEATGHETEAEREGHSTVYDQRSGRILRRRRTNWRHDYAGHDAPDNVPVVHVSWRDARTYTAWLAEMTAQPYRLPSEAQFEYSMRAGSTTRYWWGDGPPAQVVENLTGQDDRSPTRRKWNRYFEDYTDGEWGPAPARTFRPNPWRLYDLAGNVSEWVEDCWHDNYLRAPTDGVAWVNPGCEQRVLRGGSWGSDPSWARSAFRAPGGYVVWNNQIGFRVARDL